ncbi:Rpn family recombination-promoting nuclease/putative transposase [Sulfurovum sp. bin170]|uniref:Rpn family recombination-promoting nuclease/putative transposase n=1 Tax=Sulfurovum sp. bin170 TaxID=2695268 RepID=UPI0013DF7447|nr:Rpn family recombination-promoting nuclease/putative transposase [Sulfurovum sp. bin170]NEW60500.1 Rpn family recombination-promoting nuclease/putative transposase [Sulfurovum sp. bin170]
MERELISFDWAIKRLLRSKANFDILEGFLSELLFDDIKILQVLESEGNKDNEKQKLNRVDLKVINSKKEIIIIEIQFASEIDYFHRILFETSKVIVEHLDKGKAYKETVKETVKVISINIVYFDLGRGEDYIYKGTTNFRGFHSNDKLELSPNQKEMLKIENIESIFPEYYILKVNRFDNNAKDSLDEWIYFLKNAKIKDSFTAKGLKKAKKEFSVLNLKEEDRIAYSKYQSNLHYEASMIFSSYGVGKMEGVKEGIEQGIERGVEQERVEGRKRIENIAKNLLLAKLDIEMIIQSTGLSKEEIEKLESFSNERKTR